MHAYASLKASQNEEKSIGKASESKTNPSQDQAQAQAESNRNQAESNRNRPEIEPKSNRTPSKWKPEAEIQSKSNPKS